MSMGSVDGARAADPAGTIGDPAMQALRRGWYPEEESFKDRLLNLLERPAPPQRAGEASRHHGEAEALRMIRQGLAILGLATDRASLLRLPKGDPGKVMLAAVLRRATSVSNSWIASPLAWAWDIRAR
jgi:hypothetical protein